MDLPELKYNEAGLIPCIVQDADTGEVLMMAWMSAESLALTLERGETVFWSRSRRELWHKGATSGNTQKLADLRYDCDADTLLALVHPAGPACHLSAGAGPPAPPPLPYRRATLLLPLDAGEVAGCSRFALVEQRCEGRFRWMSPRINAQKLESLSREAR